MPKDFPNQRTVYHYYYRWINNGTWEKIHDGLVKKCREQKGKKSDKPTIGIIDSQSVKSCQKSEEKGFDAGKRLKA